MFGNLSYLYSIFIFALPIIFIELIFFYHRLKKHTHPILFTIMCGLIIVQMSEPLGIYMQVWLFGLNTTLPTLQFGVKLESYLYVVVGSIAVSSAALISSQYQDMGVKNIFLQGLKDLLSTKYAIWRR